MSEGRGILIVKIVETRTSNSYIFRYLIIILSLSLSYHILSPSFHNTQSNTQSKDSKFQIEFQSYTLAEDVVLEHGKFKISNGSYFAIIHKYLMYWNYELTADVVIGNNTQMSLTLLKKNKQYTLEGKIKTKQFKALLIYQH